MFTFIFGFICGYSFMKFKGPLVLLWSRTQKKIEKSINDTNA